MILNYSELKHSIKHIRDEFIVGDTWRFGKIQKLFSSGSLLVLSVRVPGKTINLAIGRGADCCGVWSIKEQVPSKYRIVKDKFLEYLRSNISGNSIIDLKIDSDDRIVSVELFDHSLLFLFWKGRSLYFTFAKKESESYSVYSPWKSMKPEKLAEINFSYFDELGRRKIESHESSEEKYLSVNFFDDTVPAVRLDNKRAKRKVENIKEDLERCMRWREITSVIEKEDVNLEDREFKYKDFKIKFETADNFYQRRDKVYLKIKKLKTGEKILRERLADAIESLENKKSEVVDQKIVNPVWVMKLIAKSEEKTQAKQIDIFEINNYKYAVGKSANGNDYLRTNWSSKTDMWIHLDGLTSAHVVIKGAASIGIEQITVAASIVADYSGFEATQIPVIYTQVKDLKGVKGSAGLVTFKKEKRVKIQKVNWKEIISSSWFE